MNHLVTLNSDYFVFELQPMSTPWMPILGNILLLELEVMSIALMPRPWEHFEFELVFKSTAWMH